MSTFSSNVRTMANEPNLCKLHGTQPRQKREKKQFSKEKESHSGAVIFFCYHMQPRPSGQRTGQIKRAFLSLIRLCSSTHVCSASVSGPKDGTIHLLLISGRRWYESRLMNPPHHQLCILFPQHLRTRLVCRNSWGWLRLLITSGLLFHQ